MFCLFPAFYLVVLGPSLLRIFRQLVWGRARAVTVMLAQGSRAVDKEELVETWQIVMYVVGAVLLVLYFKRRSDRLSRGE